MFEGKSYIMKEHKEVAKSLEHQHIKYVKHFYRTLAEINIKLANIHKSIEHRIDKQKYRYATEYVNQFISYTTVWNIKFVYNLENPEVVLLQIFHLDYIFEREAKNQFKLERQQFEEQKKLFSQINPFKEEQMTSRKQKMFDYIAQQEKENPTILHD